MKIDGIVVPLVTPIDVNGNVDKVNLKKLIQYVMKNGVSALMPTAGTGEGVGLSMRQRLEAVRICVEEVNGKCNIVPGVIVPGWGDCVDITLEYKSIGVDAVMLLTPYYTSFGGQDALLNYFKRFIDKTDVPLMIENLPSRTGINMLPETFLALAQYSSNFIALKECTKDIMQFTSAIYLLKNHISILCGFESMAAASFILGADGGVIATANLFPQVYVKLLQAVREQRIELAKRIHFDVIRPLDTLAYLSPNPGPIRYALEYLKVVKTGQPIPPVQPLTQAVQNTIKNTLSEIINNIKSIGI